MTIKYEKRDGVAYITLNNPDKANILDKPTSDAISEAWTDLWEDRDIRCAILTGEGNRHFCGGHNLAPWPDLTEDDANTCARSASSGRWPAPCMGKRPASTGAWATTIRGCGSR